MSEEVGDLKDTLMLKVYDIFGERESLNPQYNQTSVVLYGGDTGVYNNWSSTDYISCETGECFEIRAAGYYNNNINICPIAFFDNNKNYISGISAADIGGSTGNRVFEKLLFIPQNAKYFKQTLYSGASFYNYTNRVTLINYDQLQEQVNKNSDVVNLLLGWKNLDITTTKTDIPLYGGGTNTYSNWFSTDFIDCSFITELRIIAWCYFASGVNICPISFYDAGKNYISAVSGEDGIVVVGSNRVYTGNISVPLNAKYFRLTAYTGSGSSAYTTSADGYTYTIERETFINRLNVVCIGDSLTEGDQGADPYASAQNITPYNYPYWMKKYLGCSVVNKGKSGYTTMQSWNNVVQNIDFTDVNTIIIMLGSNGGLTDTIETDCPENTSYINYANTNTGCYCKIIEYCMAQTNGTAQIILCTPPHVGKIRGSKRTTTIEAAEVVRKIALRYSLPLIDMMLESGFNDYNENVYQPVDGLHFTVAGYKKMGTFIGSRI